MGEYLHINYQPDVGWVLTIMSRLQNSSKPELRKAFDQWHETPLKELGLAITTRMHMLGLCIKRLNKRVDELRREMSADIPQVEECLSKGYAFRLKDKELPYELLLDMDSFIFETRSLYEIMGKFLVSLFQTLFARHMTEGEIQSTLSSAGIDVRWIEDLRENRKLFFHDTAPWLAARFLRENSNFDPVLLKRNVIEFDDPDSWIDFIELRQIYDGFVNSAGELHRFLMEQIRLRET